jgi:hypothetical protein
MDRSEAPGLPRQRPRGCYRHASHAQASAFSLTAGITVEYAEAADA